MRKNIFYTAALLLAGAVMAACSGSDDITSDITPEPQPSAEVGTVELSGTLGSKGSTTRAVDADGNGTWEVGDKFAVYYQTANGNASTVATVNSVNNDGSANFTAVLHNPKAGDNDVMLVYPASAHDGQGGFKTDDLMNQRGTLEYINQKGLDIETASTTMNVEGMTAKLKADVTMQPQVCLSTFILNKSNYSDLPATKLEISDGTNTYTITPAAATSNFTVALLPIYSHFTFTATTTELTTSFTKLDNVTIENCTAANIGDVFDKDGNIYRGSLVPGLIYTRTTNGTVNLKSGMIYKDQRIILSQAAIKNPGVAVIAYVGNQGSVDNSNEETQIFRGLAVALNYVNGEAWLSNYSWCSKTTGTSTSCSNENSDDITVALQWKNGIGRTAYLIDNSDGHTHTAAGRAHNYGVSHPAGTSDWFLASLGQWQLIFQGLATKAGNMSELCNKPMLLFQYPKNYILSNDNVGPVIENSGALGFSNCVWSSSEYSETRAWALAFDLSATNLPKSSPDHAVRPVIAF